MKWSRCLTLLVSAWITLASGQVKTGADLLFEKYFSLVEGKRVGLVTNHSALLSDGRHLADVLAESKNTTLRVLFGPEHGIRGDAPDGRTVQHGVDTKTGLPVYSLYGKINKPTPEMLKDVDVLVYDIQDVGVRFYTFESTLALAMEGAAEKGIPFVVLDRPNPIRGTWVEGFIRTDSLRSFVGLNPTPIAHGMTVGELATMFNEEGWLKNGIKAKLTVVKMEGWKREMWMDETGLKWVKPSPNMATLQTAIVYPGTCLIEGTNISEGRGSDRPFEYLGAPYVDGKRLADTLNTYKLEGVQFEPTEFTPAEIPNVTNNPKHKGQKCSGIFVRVSDRNAFQPVKTAVYILSAAKRLFPNHFQWRGSIDRLAGTTKLRVAIDSGISAATIAAMWGDDVAGFNKIRSKYLLY
ncbi:MAG: DUF1343 domain-containing protein [Bacteroidota bacterium]